MNQRLAIIILLLQLTGIYGKLELSGDGRERDRGSGVKTGGKRRIIFFTSFFFVASRKLTRLAKLNIAILEQPDGETEVERTNNCVSNGRGYDLGKCESGANVKRISDGSE